MNDFGRRLDQLAGSATRGKRLVDPSFRHDAARAGIAPRRAVGLAFAAVAIVFAGIIWSQSATEQSTPVIATEGDTDTENRVVAGAPSYLLATSEDWVAVSYKQTEGYNPGPVPEEINPDTWAWQLDDKLVILVQGSLASRDLGLDEAEVEETVGRTRLSWNSSGGGLIGQETSELTIFDGDEAVARSIAEALRPTADGWELPGSVRLAAEVNGRSFYPTRESITLSPLDDTGRAILGRRIHHHVEEGSPAAIYRALAATRVQGTLRQTTIADQPGLVLVAAEDQGAWAAAQLDGWVFTWRASGAVDNERFSELLESVEVVKPVDWVTAVEDHEDEVAKVVAAAAIDGDALPTGPDLPRFVLPNVWSLERVIDMAILPAEERAREIVLAEAQDPSSGQTLLVRTRVQLIRRANDTGLLPAASIATDVFDDSVDPLTLDENDTPLSIGPLHGWVRDDKARLSGANVRIVVDRGGLSGTEFSELVGSLTLRSEDPEEGLAIVGDRYRQSNEFTNDTPITSMRDALPYWASEWSYDGRDAFLTVSKLTAAEMEHAAVRLMQRSAFRSDGPMSWDTAGSLDGQHIVGSLPDGATAFRYDTAAEVFVDIRVWPPPEQAAEGLLAALRPVDLDEWAEIATPFNALGAG